MSYFLKMLLCDCVYRRTCDVLPLKHFYETGFKNLDHKTGIVMIFKNTWNVLFLFCDHNASQELRKGGTFHRFDLELFLANLKRKDSNETGFVCQRGVV